MTLQEIFDKSTRGIIAQGGPGTIPPKDFNGNANGVCLYRAANGRKCAAGQLIEDKDYEPEFEHKGIRTVCKIKNLRFSDDSAEDLYDGLMLIEDLQRTHDGAAIVLTSTIALQKLDPHISDGIEFFNLWKPNLAKVAERYKLNTNVLDEIPTE